MLLDRKVDKEYAGIMGYDFFRKEAYKLAFGEDQNFKENCVRDKLLLEYSFLPRDHPMAVYRWSKVVKSNNHRVNEWECIEQ